MTTDVRSHLSGVWPFAAVAVLAQLALGWPVADVQRPAWAAAGTVLFALTVVCAVVAARPHRPGWLSAGPAFLFLVVVGLWRHADGASASGFAPILGLPVLWLALHGTRRQVWASVVAVGVVLVTPILLVGAPDYPASDWRRAIMMLALTGLMGPITYALVRERAASQSRLIALEPVESRLEGLLSAATGHSVIATDLDGLITVFNPGAEAMLGWSSEEMVGHRTPAVLHDPEEVTARAAELGIDAGFAVLVHAAARGEQETRDWTYVRRDGSRLTVSLTVTGIRTGAGELVGYIGIATDVTDVRRAHAELHAQQAIHRLLIDNLPDTVVAMLDVDLTWITVGGQWLDEHRVTPGSLVGRRPGDSQNMVDPDALVSFLRAALTQPMHGDFATVEGTLFEMHAVPVEGPAGERLCLVVTRDITERRRDEELREEMMIDLSASEERFRNTFEDAPIGIALRTVGAGDDDTRFLQVNRAFGLIVGADPATLAGTRVVDLEHPEDHLAPGAAGLSDSRSQQMRYRHASGRWVWVEASSSFVRDATGRASYAVTQVVDITDRRASETALLDALEQQRTAGEGLREVDRVRTEVMATISHELRTPLTSIGGYLDLLSEGDAGELNEVQAEMVDIALRNADRLAALIEDLLVLSRFDAGVDRTGATRPIEVNAMVTGALDTFRPLVRRRDQTLEVRLPEKAPTVLGDPEQLDRVLVNLITNASKYTPDGGTILIEVDAVDGQVALSVTDTGIGIPPDEQARLFERFFRASTAHEQGIAGTGLGLAIVHTIVERHGGSITLSSAPGAGSRFTVTLPSAPTGASSRAQQIPDRSIP